jgi:hypothetical protein
MVNRSVDILTEEFTHRRNAFAAHDVVGIDQVFNPPESL